MSKETKSNPLPLLDIHISTTHRRIFLALLKGDGYQKVAASFDMTERGVEHVLQKTRAQLNPIYGSKKIKKVELLNYLLSNGYLELPSLLGDDD